MIEKIVFISPMYNAASHIDDLIDSLLEQSNDNWEHIFIDDMSTDSSCEIIKKYLKKDNRIKLLKNKQKKYALKNVIEASRKYENNNNVAIAIIDADDALCNENTVQLLLDAYNENKLDTVWTAHSWDINGMNISKELPKNINPYQYPWCTSHLKTFRSTLLKDISNQNFKDLSGNWFKRGYDQALYLPLLHKSSKRKYLNEICYLYRINSNSVDVRIWSEKDQMDTVRLVRSRGLV